MLKILKILISIFRVEDYTINRIHLIQVIVIWSNKLLRKFFNDTH